MNVTCPSAVLAAAMIFCVFEAPRATAHDWPQWQGPQRDAMSKETGLLKVWPKDGPPLGWRIEGLGGGYSSPSIAMDGFLA